MLPSGRLVGCEIAAIAQLPLETADVFPESRVRPSDAMTMGRAQDTHGWWVSPLSVETSSQDEEFSDRRKAIMSDRNLRDGPSGWSVK